MAGRLSFTIALHGPGRAIIGPMNKQPESSFRGNPPKREQLAELLKDHLAQWNEVRETVAEIGATWKWAFSEATNTWTYRSYLPGDRFFASLTLKDEGFEVSTNLKADEWDAVTPTSPEEAALLESLRAKALASGDDPAWLHVAVTGKETLPLLAQILVVRARRPQKPRLKAGKKRR
ncbi:hypothetical protein D3C86_994900 [compost metagenome]